MDKYPDNTKTYSRLLEISLKNEYEKKHDIKVGFIVPPSPFVVPTGWEWVHTAPFEGPSVIASVIKGLGFEFELLDQREDIDPESLANGPLKKFDIIGITTYEDSFPYLKKVIEIAKKEDPDRPIILGGPLVTSVPELIMNNTLADYAIIGEGELTTIEFFDNFIKNQHFIELKDIKGLSYKENGKVIVNEKREQMYNIDAVPIQDFSVWPSIQKTGNTDEIYMTSSRGCPGNCSFCFRTMPKLRHKSPERVRRELLHLKKYGFKMVWWSDLTFIDNIERIHKLMDIGFNGIDFRWCCFTRVNGIDLEVLKHMKEHGCDLVMYGFESITEDILGYFRKGIDKNQMINAIKLTRESGLKVGGLFIIGGPGESNESLERLDTFCKEFKEVTRVKYMSALPGTPLYYDAIKNGKIKNELDHLYFLSKERSVEDDEFINFTELSEQTLRDAYKKINHRIEVRPYEYWNEKNNYLDKPEKFKLRPISDQINR